MKESCRLRAKIEQDPESETASRFSIEISWTAQIARGTLLHGMHLVFFWISRTLKTFMIPSYWEGTFFESILYV